MDISAFQILEFYLLSALLGALMGLERERKSTKIAGLRTFMLVTLFGCLCAHLSEVGGSTWLIPAGIGAVTLQSAIMQMQRVREDESLGLTTAVALVIAYGIGVLVALGMTEAAVALSLITTAILYFKPQMHAFSRRLSAPDIHAILQFVLIAFVILPILPDRGYGPYKALNPYNIWLMVVMISALNLTGYVTVKFIGRRWSGPVLGLLGGLVSSTATTLSFSRHARKHPGFSLTAAIVVSLASAVVLLRMAVLIGVVHYPLLYNLAWPFAAMFVCALIPITVAWKKSVDEQAPLPETKNPAELKQALLFGFLYAVVLLAVSAGKDIWGDSGVYAVSFLSGLTDVDAITLSNAHLVDTGTLEAGRAGVSILIAFAANMAFKLAMVAVVGTHQMLRWALVCFLFLVLPALVIFV
ncbi:MAG: MgtC/SapB family protein [Geobacteraceae bacterium]|nr:MgtC/SapB family protein [Geobacteraceae bacterium]